MAAITQGELEWAPPAAGKPCRTWYRVVGNLAAGTPLVALHGWPGVPSGYLAPLEDVALKHNFPLVVYDQLGCGKSTRLPEKGRDESFWTLELFLEELRLVLAHLGIETFDLYGHSWGGFLAFFQAQRDQQHVRKLILSNTPATAALWAQAAREYLAEFPAALQETIARHEAAGTFDSPEFGDAMMQIYKKHLITVEPIPPAFLEAFGSMQEDPVVYNTLWGESEFTVTGSLKDLSLVEHLPSIKTPTLVIHGERDMCSPAAVEPYRTGLSSVKIVTLSTATHTPFYEDYPRFEHEVGTFLSE